MRVPEPIRPKECQAVGRTFQITDITYGAQLNHLAIMVRLVRGHTLLSDRAVQSPERFLHPAGCARGTRSVPAEKEPSCWQIEPERLQI